jgi:hypothetical protein
VIRAAEELAGVAGPVDDDLGTLVRAAVVKHVHLAVAVTDLDHRLVANLRGEVIALVRRLAFMSDKHPRIGEQVLHLEPVDLLIDVDVAMDFVSSIQRPDRRRIVCISSHSSLPYRSSTRRADFARLTQICITLPSAFSASLRTTSR